jgi:hypothetical protein
VEGVVPAESAEVQRWGVLRCGQRRDPS